MKRHGALLAMLAVVSLAACTTEKIVYRTREPFNPPADPASGFLGYFDVATKQTACGNCHVSHQGRWEATAHASAWASLQAVGAQPYCTGCHSVSGKGNAMTGNVGYNAVPDASYHDVQCESCHGPGFTHAQTPDATAPPLARVAVKTADSAGTCGECHSGTHTPFAEEWAQSRHGRANPEVIASYVATPTNTTCVSCHEGHFVLKAWGVTANYQERDQAVTATTALGITCAVCHDPHGSANTKQLRFPIDNPDPAQNLCMKCHMRKTTPSASNSRGNSPHAPQGAVLLGEAGWQNPAYLDTTLLNASSVATHGSPTANPRLCAGCHLFRFATTDTAGAFNQATGHLFRPIPCYGGNGLPTDTIQNCAYSAAARSFKACTNAGCHVSGEAQVANLVAVDRGRLRSLSHDLWVDVNHNETVDAFPTDSGILARVKANTTDLNPSNSVITAADGAEFNVKLVGEDTLGFLYSNGDKSHGVHNPFIAEALLRANVDELTNLYSAQPWWVPPSAAVQQILGGPLGATGSVPFPRPVVRRTASR